VPCRTGSATVKGKTMQQFKDIRDVFDFAIEKEEASFQLYTKAAAMVESTASRKMLEEMAGQELGHKRLLQGMDREKVREYRFVKVPDLKIGDYLVDVEYRDDMTFQEILVFAMKAEEKAAQLYSEASHLTDVPEIQRMLLMLANEEKRHKFNLESLYDDKILTEKSHQHGRSATKIQTCHRDTETQRHRENQE